MESPSPLAGVGAHHLSVRRVSLLLLESIVLLAVIVPVVQLKTVIAVLQGKADLFPWFDAIMKGVLVLLPCQLVFFLNDLYDWRIIRNKHQTSIRLLESCSYALILIAMLYFSLDGYDRLILELGPGKTHLGRFKASFLPVLAVIFLVYCVAYGYRRAFDWTVFNTRFADRLLMIGDGPIAENIERELRERADPSYEIAGYVLSDATEGENERDGKTIVGGYDRIVPAVKELNIQRVIVCLPERRGNLPVLELLNCRLQGVRVEEGELLYERITGKIAVAKLRPSYLIFSEGFNRSKFTYILKRALDVVIASVGIVLASPIALITAVLIKLDSRGPVFFSQARVGKEGRIFHIHKFRSMKTDAEKESGPVWATQDDDRVTRVGKVIRLIRVDEIPQLLNVLRNEMSFVGPRPERPFFVEELKQEIPYYTERLVVKPGVTGWAQINYRYGASKEDAVEKLQYDLYYIKNMSIFLDILILFRTIKVVLLGFGAR